MKQSLRGLRTANDKTRWIEARIREPISERPHRCPDAQSLLTWLERSKPGTRWTDVARRYFPGISKVAAISKARRAYGAVERFLYPNEKQLRAERLDKKIREHFECSPREFKDYLESI